MPYMKKVMTETERAALAANLKTRPAHLKLAGITSPVCDFCGADNPVYMYAANRTTTGIRIRCWRWSACEFCSIAVDANDWDYIEDKITEKVKKMIPQSITEEVFINLGVKQALSAFHEDAVRLPNLPDPDQLT